VRNGAGVGGCIGGGGWVRRVRAAVEGCLGEKCQGEK